MTKKIMVVDDEPDIVSVTKEVLERGGYKVISAGSGLECLKKLDKETVDLILLDIMMPDLGGWDVAAKIKENPKWNGIPIVFLTIKGDTMSVGMGKLSADDYIVKPFDNDALLERVDKILKE